MTLNIDLILALLVGIPCIIVLVKATDSKARLVPAITLACAGLAALAPVISSHAGKVDVGQIAWIVTGVMSIIAGVRAAQPVYTSLIITGGALGALLATGLIARS